MPVAPAQALTRALAVFATTLAVGVPVAAAQDPVVTTSPDGAVQAEGGIVLPEDPAAPVGPGEVITDGADETEPAPSVDPTPPKRGEVHVLDTARASAPVPVAAPAPVASAAPVTSPRRTTATRASAATLPFTGVNAGLVALMGAALLAAGLALQRVSARPL